MWHLYQFVTLWGDRHIKHPISYRGRQTHGMYIVLQSLLHLARGAYLVFSVWDVKASVYLTVLRVPENNSTTG